MDYKKPSLNIVQNICDFKNEKNEQSDNKEKDSELKKNKKIKKNKCYFCNKKLGLVSFDCESCEKNFCTSCRYPEIHKCPNIDNKINKELYNLDTQLVKVDFDKVNNKL